MSGKEVMWRWADLNGQQRRVRFDELRAALAGGLIAPNTPVWQPGWPAWQPAHEVPELTTSALNAANGLIPNIPPPPLAVVAVQREFEAASMAPRAPSMYEEPPPVPQWAPAAAKSGSLAPPPPAVVPPPDLGSGRLFDSDKVAAAPKLGASLPTAIGLPPPPQLVADMALKAKAAPAPVPKVSHDADEGIEELSDSMLVDESNDQLVQTPLDSGDLPPPTDPVIREEKREGDTGMVAAIRPSPIALIVEDIKRLRAKQKPKNPRMLAVVGGVAVLGVITFFGLIISAISGGGSSDTTKTKGSASVASSSGPPSSSTLEVTSAAPPVVAPVKEEPKPTAGVELGDCVAAGEGKTLAARALIATGIEAAAGQSALALGFAPSLHDAVGVSIDPGSLTPTATVRAGAKGDIRRVVPFFSGGKVVIIADSDRKGDRMTSRRFVPTSNPVDIGVAENGIVWAPHGKDSYAKLFDIDGDAPVEAMKAIPLASGKGVAVAFRRGNSVFVGVATGDATLTAEGQLSRVAGLGQVGSPAIATSGDSIVVAWADRASKDDPWGIRWTKRSISGATIEPRALAVPDGGLGGPAMSPSVAGLGRGRFLLAWTEGPSAPHQVRALTFDASGMPSGGALSISASGLNAGQPSAVVGVDGRGVVAFLSAKGKTNELVATPITCPAR